MAELEFLIPGYGYIVDKDEDEQIVIPGYGMLDEEGAGAPPAPPSVDRRRIIVTS